MSTHEIDLSRAVWRTASYTNGNGACVEVASIDGTDGALWIVRDSKDRTGPVLTVTPAGWSAFTTGVCAGQFG